MSSISSSALRTNEKSVARANINNCSDSGISLTKDDSTDSNYNSIMNINKILSTQDDLRDGTVHYAAEIIPDRFYFATLRSNFKLKSTQNSHYFTIDDELVYENFNSDFGPLNLAMLFRYCLKLNMKFKSAPLLRKRIIHYTSSEPQKRVNAAFLVGAFSIIYLNKKPDEAYRSLVGPQTPSFIPFRDASFGSASFYITLLDVLNGVYKAHLNKFFDFRDFDCAEYEYYEKVENADLNWILPEKFIAFCGPHSKTKVLNGYPLHAPEAYFSYYRKNNVKCIVRLNRHIYDASRFTNAGFQHKDLFFTDGSTPSDLIMNQFLELSEKTDGAIAVHCKAGLGRTGSLIGCFIMKHYRFTAKEAIAWVRLCRPGSVIGMQQEWLEEKEALLWKAGDKLGTDGAHKARWPIYSVKRKTTGSTSSSYTGDNVKSILAQVDSMRLEDREENGNEQAPEDGKKEEEDENDLTQGDMLNRIKALRQHHLPLKGLNTRKGTNAGDSKSKDGPRLKRTAGPYTSPSNASKSNKTKQQQLGLPGGKRSWSIPGATGQLLSPSKPR